MHRTAAAGEPVPAVPMATPADAAQAPPATTPLTSPPASAAPFWAAMRAIFPPTTETTAVRDAISLTQLENPAVIVSDLSFWGASNWPPFEKTSILFSATLWWMTTLPVSYQSTLMMSPLLPKWL